MNKLLTLIGIVSTLAISACGSQTVVGPAGPQGPQGTAGTNGTGLTLSSIRNCSKIASGLLFIYQIATYSTGDTAVNCSISTAVAAYTGLSIYKAGTPGATTHSCTVGYDVDTATAGYWVFTSNASTTAVYNDSGSASNGLTITFALTDCTTS